MNAYAWYATKRYILVIFRSLPHALAVNLLLNMNTSAFFNVENMHTVEACIITKLSKVVLLEKHCALQEGLYV